MNTSATVIIISTTSAAAASQSWLRCVTSARCINRCRKFMACPRLLLDVVLVELAAGLAGLVDRGNRLLDLRRHPLLELGDVGVGQGVDLHALLDELLAAVPFGRLPQLAVLL